jgi:hypothetical protein
MGTSMADFFERRGYLTEKQTNYWRAKMADGNSRIEIYSRQLLEEAVIKHTMKVLADAAKAGVFRERRPGEDVGNYEEERMMQAEMIADRQGTIRDEMNKRAARDAMESV